MNKPYLNHPDPPGAENLRAALRDGAPLKQPTMLQVRAALAHSADAAGDLEKIISVLEERLVDVLRLEEKSSGIGGLSSGTPLVGVAMEMERQTDSIQCSINRISSILDRLEL